MLQYDQEKQLKIYLTFTTQSLGLTHLFLANTRKRHFSLFEVVTLKPIIQILKNMHDKREESD